MKKLLSFALTALASGAGLVALSATTRELRDGKYWIDVPAGETAALTAADVAVLVPESGTQPQLWKIGEGTLEMATNEATKAFVNYNADIYVTNGLMKVLSEYGLGNFTTGKTGENSQTFVWPGAALDSAYQRDEKATGGASVGITQREMIHVAGTGYGDYGVLNETVGNHIMLGKVTLDGDAKLGRPGNGMQIRYHKLDFNGHQITSGGNLGFGSLPVANVPEVPLVMSTGHTLTFTGTGMSSTETNHRIRFEDNTTFNMESLSSATYYWGLDFVSNGTMRVVNTTSSATAAATNTWNGPIAIGPGGTLNIGFRDASTFMRLNKPITGAGIVNVYEAGTLELGAAEHRIRRLVLGGSNRKLRLPDDFVLEVQSFSVNGKDQSAGDYTSANCANILAGTVRVTPDAKVYSSGTTVGDDYSVASYGSAPPQVERGTSGGCSLTADGTTEARFDFTGLDRLLGKAHFHVDATVATSITYIAESTWTSTNGLRGVNKWQDLNSEKLYFYNFPLTSTSTNPNNKHQSRYVSAYPTLQAYTVNGVTRPYMDMGELDGKNDTSEICYDNWWSDSPTTAGMLGNSVDSANCTLAGLEYHTVFGDAHPNPTNSNRMCLFGRTNCAAGGGNVPEFQPGRRGKDGMLFAEKENVTTAFSRGLIWADNVATNYTYTPEWGDVHVYTVIPTNAFVGETHTDYRGVYSIGVDSYARYGGARYGEMLVYSGATNTAAERARIDAYLMKKWIGRGVGAEMTLETVTLKNGADLSLGCAAYADVGVGYRIGTLKGDGAVSVGAKDALFVASLSFAFTDRDVCDSLSTDAALTLAEAGTVTVALPNGRHPKAGSYKLFEATNATSAAALDGWTLVCDDPLVTLRRDGNVLYADVAKKGLTILIR